MSVEQSVARNWMGRMLVIEDLVDNSDALARRRIRNGRWHGRSPDVGRYCIYGVAQDTGFTRKCVQGR